MVNSRRVLSIYDHASVAATRGDGRTEAIKKAQENEFAELIRIVPKLFSSLGRPLTVLDIGVGNGRTPQFLSPDMRRGVIGKYIGLDLSRSELRAAEKKLGPGPANSFTFVWGDARYPEMIRWPKSIDLRQPPFDLVLCTYFTAGNLRPEAISTETVGGKPFLKLRSDGFIAPYPKSCLNPNRAFVNAFEWCWEKLRDGGAIVLGSIYIDNEMARLKQEEFYRNCGMTVITDSSHSFTATRQGFFSERFTDERLRYYLGACGIPWKNVSLIPLDEENFAQMIIIRKK